MHLIDENFQPILRPKQDKTYPDCLYWEYNPNKKKFVLTRQDQWTMIHSDAYTISIGKYTLDLPVNHYLTIGDFDGGIDFIRIDEVIGRDFQVFVFTTELEDDIWMLQDLKVKQLKKDIRVAYPQTKRPVAVHLGDNKAVLVSNIDQYSKMGDLSFGDIV